MLNGIAYTLISVYGLIVLYRGRLDELFALLRNEGRFVEMVIAFAILDAVARNDKIGQAGKIFMTIAATALLLKVAMNPNVEAVLTAMRNGASFGDAIKSATVKTTP